MSVIDPEVPIPLEEPAVPQPAPPASSKPKTARAICALCKRPVIEWPAELRDDGNGLAEPLVTHLDASFDARNGGPCIAELYIEPAIRWGHLNDPKR